MKTLARDRRTPRNLALRMGCPACLSGVYARFWPCFLQVGLELICVIGGVVLKFWGSCFQVLGKLCSKGEALKLLPRSFQNRPQIVPGWTQNRSKNGLGRVWRAFRALWEGVSAAFGARSQKKGAPGAPHLFLFSVFGLFWEPRGEAKIDKNRKI